MVTASKAIDFYKYFYKKKYALQPNFNLRLSERQTKFFDTFIELIHKAYDKSVGVEFLYTYFLYQFQYWEEALPYVKAERGKNIDASYIVGKKAVQRFIERNTAFDYKIEKSDFAIKYKIVKDDLVKRENLNVHVFIVKRGRDTEAPIKMAAFNTYEGFVNCMDFSTLFDPKSDICAGCKFASDCKAVLKKNYPKMYRNRGIVD